jgi:hypothetical protein
MGRGCRIGAVLAAAGLAALPVVAADPDPPVKYWLLRDINFPVPVDRIEAMAQRPSKLRFYVAQGRGRFTEVDSKAVADLPVINPDKNQRGFRYTSPADGEYDFALQFVYADGTAQPADRDLSAQWRIVFDTRPPEVRVAPLGTSGIEWEVTDENLAADSVTVETRWARSVQRGEPRWYPVSRSFRPQDRYTWSRLEEPLEVRVVARDKAGHERASRVVTLPTNGGNGLDLAGTRDDFPRPAERATERAGSGFGNPAEFTTPRPQIEYVPTKQLVVESKPQRITRSGIRAAHLWVDDGRVGWKPAGTKSENILPSDRDPVIRMPYTADKDGLYGFIVIPESGARSKADDPRPGDPPQYLVEVDTTKPVVKVLKHTVYPGGAVGPKVRIEWEVTDKNLLPEPIEIHYAETPNPAGNWKPVTDRKLPNTGRYEWEIEDKDLWLFYVRVRATDKATNVGEAIYDKQILIDLEKPAATIEKVTGTAGGSGKEPQSESEKRPFDPPVTPAPASTPVPSGPVNPFPASGGPPAVPALPPSGK